MTGAGGQCVVQEDSATTAIDTAAYILKGLARTRLAPLLELKTVTSTIELPPVQKGPFPLQLTKIVKETEKMPSEELWNVVRTEFLSLVSRSEQLLAQVVLQEAFCQQLQRKLALREKIRKKLTLQKVNGLDNGFIFTSDEAYAILEADAAEKGAKELEAELKQNARKLKKDAKEWMAGALLRQKVAHAELIKTWEGLPKETRPKRKPTKPKLDPTPQEYKEALKPRKKKVSKDIESTEESGNSEEEWY
jgi:gas vesicle protein